MWRHSPKTGIQTSMICINSRQCRVYLGVKQLLEAGAECAAQLT
jgi:hypothetical protein